MERNHYLWTAGSSTVRVYLAASVINRLRVASAANSAAPEIGGILLGRRKSDDCVSIEDFDLVESEHRRGLTFTLSSADKRRLAQQCRASLRGLQPVGSFRTHRRQGLYMDEYDFDLMSEHFSAATDVMLLIHPTDWHAGFFVWEDGDIARQKSYMEFPFDATALPLTAIGPTVAAPARQATAPRSTQNFPTLMKVGLIAATAGIAAVLAFYSHEHRAADAVNSISSAEAPPLTPVSRPVYPDLKPPDDQPDDPYEVHVQIPPRPSPFSNAEVLVEPTVVTSLAVRQAASKPAPLPQSSMPPAPVEPVQTSANLPVPVVASSVLQTAGNLPAAPVVARAALQPMHPPIVSEVSLEPSQPGVLRRGIHHLPVLNLLDKHGYKSGSSFSPARPLRQVKPRLPDDLRAEAENRPVDVKVWIDDNGEVTKTELLSDDVQPEIADLASNAASKWSFQPARVSDRPVASEMVMHFRFVPRQNY